MNSSELKNFHYNNQNEIQFEYDGRTHQYSMECIKDIICYHYNNLKEVERLNITIMKCKIMKNELDYAYPMEVKDVINVAIDMLEDYLEELKGGDK